MARPVHTLLSSDGAGITLDPLLYGAYRNTDGLSNPGLSSTTTRTLLHFSPRTAQALHWTHCYMELIGILMGSPILVSAAQRQGHFSTSLLRWCKHYVVPMVKCSYRNSDGLSNPGLSSTTMGTVLISALLKDTGGEQQYKVSQEKPKGTPRFNIYYPIPNIPP